MADDSFAELMVDCILGLPADMKEMLRILEDPDLSLEHRTVVAGSLLHVVSGSNAIPGMRGVLAYVDDVIVLRLVLERLQKEVPEIIEKYSGDSPDLIQPLAEHMEIVRGYLGNLLSVVEKACLKLSKETHQGRSAAQCAQDDEGTMWLYDTVQEALVEELEFDEDEVVRAMRQVSQIKRPLEQRLK